MWLPARRLIATQDPLDARQKMYPLRRRVVEFDLSYDITRVGSEDDPVCKLILIKLLRDVNDPVIPCGCKDQSHSEIHILPGWVGVSARIGAPGFRIGVQV